MRSGGKPPRHPHKNQPPSHSSGARDARPTPAAVSSVDERTPEVEGALIRDGVRVQVGLADGGPADRACRGLPAEAGGLSASPDPARRVFLGGPVHVLEWRGAASPTPGRRDGPRDRRSVAAWPHPQPGIHAGGTVRPLAGGYLPCGGGCRRPPEGREPPCGHAAVGLRSEAGWEFREEGHGVGWHRNQAQQDPHQPRGTHPRDMGADDQRHPGGSRAAGACGPQVVSAPGRAAHPRIPPGKGRCSHGEEGARLHRGGGEAHGDRATERKAQTRTPEEP
jgi:hypothetical protein